MEILLALIPPMLGFIYKILGYYGFWDYITGRKYALIGVERMKSGKGYPQGWIYNDTMDKRVFRNLYRRMIKRSMNQNFKPLLDEHKKPSLITLGGDPIKINGIDPKWEQENRIIYTANHPIMLVFDVRRSGSCNGSGGRCCSLGELERWLDEEKKSWDFWAGTVILSLFSLTLGVLGLL